MKTYDLSYISGIIHAKAVGNTNFKITYLSNDTRRIIDGLNTLFFALKTNTNDGHKFVLSAYNNGVRCFVVEHLPDKAAEMPEACFLIVENSLTALQILATAHRSSFNIPVIGITGSNGKTIVKEWLYQLLHRRIEITRSPKSYNSQIGVPLSVWNIDSNTRLGIFEAGISMPGEMAALEKMIQPTIGIFTNIGEAHQQHFTSLEQKASEKIKLFAHSDIIIFNRDNEIINKTVSETTGLNTFTWGYQEGCDVRILSIYKHAQNTTVHINIHSDHHRFEIPFIDDASIENVLHCLATCVYLKQEMNETIEGIQQLKPVEMRLFWKKAIHNSYLINDSYSNDLNSFKIALDYLYQQRQSNKLTVILSDVTESSTGNKAIYEQVVRLLKDGRINRLIAIGEQIARFRSLFENEGISTSEYPSTEAFIQALPGLTFNNENILLKGARRFRFERIANILELQTHETTLEINLTAITHNLKAYKNLLKPSTRLMVMVKAYGYGSGDAEVAKLLQFNHVDYLTVAYIDEGIALRKAGITLPIMVLNVEESGYNQLEQYNLEPEIFSFHQLNNFYSYCLQNGITQQGIHIKLDTGMHRLGFLPEETEALGKKIQEQNILFVKSAFTHFAASEDPDEDDFTHLQADLFIKSCNTLEEQIGYSFIKHCCNTAGIERHPQYHMGMVRLGVGLYEGNKKLPGGETTIPVGSLKATVAQIKHLQEGDTVGYNRRFKATKPTNVATIRIGYADGLRRSLGNNVGEVFINNHRAPIIGSVCMDMCMIDITNIPANVGDTAEIFGMHIPVKEVAQKCQTISYEILTGIGQRVKRVYIEE
ncbi:bifunctional UDP-N-acetylmuramoyl-tripeptide:D-alanyl-D-alanine ligase/alanine racemase [Polluticaenibacter yanchengensis]|uniref:Alanine racemase n=1 Tax=Polluticaenibacter yanchengensis TaxID=3014562 RepID=A0ABT4UPK2_9BACT|nr:bifunctional UDP-N-acetylmuramoyl-tripeptide:D-alanyl-D-alanine ligase/alanine racemase [Chitinophagaceae bacterium LY-5]